MSTATLATQPDVAVSTRLYRAIWRWHFYAGLYVIPFLLVLACTGLIMVYGNSIETFLGAKHYVAPVGERASYEAQSQAAVAAISGGALKLMVVPKEDDRATVFIVNGNGKDNVVAVDPHGAKALDTIVKDDTWFYWADNIHGTLLLGDVGDRLIEVAAGLGIVLILTGLYMWWPRNGRSLGKVLFPNLSARGRSFWKEIHVSLGFYISIVLFFFLLSGLSWTGIWGTKIMQAWSTFPAAKWDNVPLSDKTHASMNHGAMKEVPWALEQTPMPMSGSQAGSAGLQMGSVNLDTVAAYARANGFTEQFRINAPQDDGGVYTISADSMDADTKNPFGDRTVHIDRYTGKILADVRFADYGLAGKAMAVGIALHQANLGWWNTALNVLFCLSVIAMALSGVVMWWKRRPTGRLGAPLYPKNYRAPVAIIVIALAVSALFPLTGIAIVVFAIIDCLVPKRFKEAGLQPAGA
ncbi:PepSY domain-containing protein [Mesorhizobium sp. B3-1-3]|uniref:PepSY-associated TM helix domain-containing protein n=1 Tax=unclassified Mesorhizobium TaxID=325217 RepID=UPI0011263788|nr:MULTISPECIES: PepSY domain-containing protein [unclassified Mesorhizobium]TPI64296.1 PepSY domain-containing protein [Mesorhizobium sp. B3-1-8]TPI70224.1 PepSY domain-containing protein [Mesorhizobium sp. B3-1-3]